MRCRSVALHQLGQWIDDPYEYAQANPLRAQQADDRAERTIKAVQASHPGKKLYVQSGSTSSQQGDGRTLLWFTSFPCAGSDKARS